MKIYMHNTLKGEVSAAWGKRSTVKLDDVKSNIAICIPVGPKEVSDVFVDGNGQRWQAPAFNAPGVVPVPLLTSILQLATPLNCAVTYFTRWGLYSGEARQIMTMTALDHVTDEGYILYWDDDTLPPPMGLHILFNYMQQNPDVGIASGVYCTRDEAPEPVVFGGYGMGTDWSITIGPDSQPQEVWGVGAGFMLVRVKAIKEAIAANPDVPIWADMQSKTVEGETPDPLWGKNVNWGHDTRFCRLIANLGYKIVVDGRVECGHYDYRTSKVYKLPDTSIPKRRGRNVNSAKYWDLVYGLQGAENMRVYAEMFDKIRDLIAPHSSVLELACGTGALGSYLTAQLGVRWRGYDLSPEAVEQAKARFLNASVGSVLKCDVPDEEWVIAMEIFEHLEAEDRRSLVELLAACNNVIITVPDNCMGPDEVKEHTLLVTREVVEQEIVSRMTLHDCEVVQGDAKHLMVIARRKNAGIRGQDQQRTFDFSFGDPQGQPT